MAIDNQGFSVHRMMMFFLSNLWAWLNVYSVDRSNSLWDFLTWLGCR